MPGDRSENYGSLNDQLIALMQIADLIKIMGSKKIILFTPFLPYTRQDKSEDKLFPGSFFMLGRILKSVGIDRIITCELHAPETLDSFPITLTTIPLSSFWATTLQERIFDSLCPKEVCIVSPDQGGRQRVIELATLLGTESAFIKKTRPSHNMAVGYELEGVIRNRHVIILDDIIDTAYTALSACELCLGRGAVHVYGCFTHALCSGDALQRLARSRIEKMFITDTICDKGLHGDNKIRPVSAHHMLVQALADYFKNQKIM